MADIGEKIREFSGGAGSIPSSVKQMSKKDLAFIVKYVISELVELCYTTDMSTLHVLSAVWSGLMDKTYLRDNIIRLLKQCAYVLAVTVILLMCPESIVEYLCAFALIINAIAYSKENNTTFTESMCVVMSSLGCLIHIITIRVICLQVPQLILFINTLNKPLNKKISGTIDIISEQLDALGDMVYYIYDTGYRKMGVNLSHVLEVIHHANMNKRGEDGKFILAPNGKVLKPEGWVPPDIASILVKYDI